MIDCELPTHKHIEVWKGVWRGVSWEINKLHDWYPYKRDYGHDGHGWTFYIILNREQFTDEQWADLWLPEEEHRSCDGERVLGAKHDYYKSQILNDVEFHGGCTYYEKCGGRTEYDRQDIKAGCDYAHSGDDERYFDLEYLWYDVRRAIDKLWNDFPELKVRCHYFGTWHTADQGEFREDLTSFSSFSGKARWKAERAAEKEVAQ